MPTWDQVKGMAERLILIGLASAAAAGWIGKDDALTYGPAILMAVGTIYAWWVNRPKAIVQSAAALPGTTVVTTPDLAKETPETNIVSSVTNIVKSTADLNREEFAKHGG